MNGSTVLPPSIGTTLKISVVADFGELHMSEVDFTCEFFTAIKRDCCKIKKSDMIYVSDDEYIAIVDTRIVGAGEYYMKLTAMIPDSDIESGFREEVIVVSTGIPVS